jgi:hypothetical protein
LARAKSNQLQQSVMLAQNISVCGNLFTEFFQRVHFNRGEKLLSSGEVITVARVVQEWAIYTQLKTLRTTAQYFRFNSRDSVPAH